MHAYALIHMQAHMHTCAHTQIPMVYSCRLFYSFTLRSLGAQHTWLIISYEFMAFA